VRLYAVRRHYLRLAAANTRQNLRSLRTVAEGARRPAGGFTFSVWRSASLVWTGLAVQLPSWLSQGPPTVGSMPPLPRLTGRELVRALGKLGWVIVAQKGSHAQLKHPSRGGRVTVPLHAGETIGPGLLRSILSQAGVSADDLRAVL